MGTSRIGAVPSVMIWIPEGSVTGVGAVGERTGDEMVAEPFLSDENAGVGLKPGGRACGGGLAVGDAGTDAPPVEGATMNEGELCCLGPMTGIVSGGILSVSIE